MTDIENSKAHGVVRACHMAHSRYNKNVADSLFETIIELQRRQGRLSIFRRFNPASRPGVAIDSQSLCSTAVMGAKIPYKSWCACTAHPKICQKILLHANLINLYSNIIHHTAIFTIINFDLRMRYIND